MKRFAKLLLLAAFALVGSAGAHAQCSNYQTLQNGMALDPIGGQVADCVPANASLQSGQIVSLNSSNYLVPIPANSTNGAIGIVVGPGSNPILVRILISGTGPVSVDNACAIGNIVEIGAIGNGHCVSSSPTTQVIGIATTVSSAASSISVQISVLASAGTSNGSSSGSFSGPVSSGNDGIHAGAFFCNGNTTLPVIPSNNFGFICPNAPTFPSYSLQFPTTAPSGTQALQCGTPSSGVSTCSFSTLASGANATLSNLGTTAINNALLPTTTNTLALGSSSLLWSIVYSTSHQLSPGNAGAPAICSTAACGSPSGIYFSGNAVGITAFGTGQVLFGNNTNPEETFASGGIVDWGSSSVTSTPDTGLCRQGAGVVEISTSTTCNSSGTIRASGFNANGTAGITVATLCSATFASTYGIVTTCTAASDPRLKMNLHPFVRGLSDVMKLHPVTYNWNEKGQKITGMGPDVLQAGFSAKDVKQAIPEAIGTETHNGVDYLSLPQGDRPIVAALVNAVKQQQKEIEELKKEVKQLRRPQ